MRKYLTEFIGTFFLTSAVASMVLGGVALVTPLAIGATLTALVYAGGYVSGAQYNPAVSLAVWLRGKMELRDMLFYMAAQLVAGVLGALVAMTVVGKVPQTMPPNVVSALTGEIAGTFGLVWVILNVATAKTVEGNNYYGIAIGFAVMGIGVCIWSDVQPSRRIGGGGGDPKFFGVVD